MMTPSHNETYRFGSAGWASRAEVRRAGLFKAQGLQIGYWNKKPVYADGDAPLITIGGAGSGKLRDLLAYVVCQSPNLRKIILDPRGELAAISLHNFARYGEYAYLFNPASLHGLPQHRLNPLDILQPGSPTLYADAKFIAEGLIALSQSHSRYFEMRARQWLESLMIALTMRDGAVSFPSLMRVINAIEGDPQAWSALLEFMLESPFEDIARTAAEMLTKQQDSEKEFGSIMGEIYAFMGVFNDPLLQEALAAPDLSLKDLCDQKHCRHLFLNIPIEYVSIWSPLLRVIFTVAMLYKGRAPEAPPIQLIADEAGQLGKAEFLLRAFTFGRGAGIRAWAIFQDIGQIKRNFGADALQGFMGSAQTRIFFGVRDLETAESVSKMLGEQTLAYNDPLQQGSAARQKKDLVQALFKGADPLASAHQFKHFKESEHTRKKQVRRLMTPAEVLAMAETRMIVFISGKGLKPLFLHKYPYFNMRAMAGYFLPNPYHPPTDQVRVQTLLGKRRRKVVTHAANIAAPYPQYQNGAIRTLQTEERTILCLIKSSATGAPAITPSRLKRWRANLTSTVSAWPLNIKTARAITSSLIQPLWMAVSRYGRPRKGLKNAQIRQGQHAGKKAQDAPDAQETRSVSGERPAQGHIRPPGPGAAQARKALLPAAQKPGHQNQGRTQTQAGRAEQTRPGAHTQPYLSAERKDQQLCPKTKRKAHSDSQDPSGRQPKKSHDPSSSRRHERTNENAL